MDVTVVVATHGGDEWKQLAENRALPSVDALGVQAIAVHQPEGTLASARNFGLDQVQTEWVSFLDGDDELEPGYFEATEQGTADLRAPSVRYVPWAANLGDPLHARARPAPRMPKVAGHRHDCDAECLAYGNWLVIGSVARTEFVRVVGGFSEYEWSEDWAVWANMWKQGATVEAIPHAVYRAHVRPDSRNRGRLRQADKHRVHQEIARDLGLPVPA